MAESSEQQSISVLIPTWRRPAELGRCVRALLAQTRPAEQIVVTVRRDDEPTWAMIEELRQVAGAMLEAVSVEPGPLTQAMNAGLARTTGSLVALTDDDAEARPDWIERMLAYFREPSVGGVGGRDWQPHERWDEAVVGRVSWFGRVTGNHHLGSGAARDVHLLKGVNCCFRGDLLRRIGFDERLRGRGNVSHWEMSLCFAFLREGERLIYDPAIAVDHHVAARHDGDVNARGGFEIGSFIDGVHNESLTLLEARSPLYRLIYRLWFTLIGTIATPGIAQMLRRIIVRREPFSVAWRRFRATGEGMALARVTFADGLRRSGKDVVPGLTVENSPIIAKASPPATVIPDSGR